MHLSKKFGQHLLIDKNIRDKIIIAGDVSAKDNIIEIGPGLGALTEEFLNLGSKVTAIEIDKGMYQALKELIAEPNLNLIHADALKVDWQEILTLTKGSYKLIANLPYNITGPLLVKLLEIKDYFSCFVLMIQKEMATRLTSSPNSKDYGALTLQLAYSMDIEMLFHVSPNSFFPPPEVDSTVIRLISKKKRSLLAHDEQFLFDLIKCGFSQRRKLLVNNIKGLGLASELVHEALKACNLKEGCRAEELNLEEFVCLANKIWTLKGGGER